MNSKRILTLIAGFLLVIPALAWAAVPNPADSMILESKTVAPGGGAPHFVLRLSITNKDSLSNVTLPYEERSLTGGAYVVVSRPRNFANTVNRLTSTLPGNLTAVYARYNDTSPDSATIAAFFDPTDIPNTAEPPNVTRKGFWELKFDTARPALGTVQFDSIKILAVTVQMVDVGGSKVDVNWVKSIVTVDIPPITNPPPGNEVPAGPGGCAQYDFDASPGCGPFSIVSGPPGATIDPSGNFNLCDQCGGSYPVTIQTNCAGSDKQYTFNATFNPGPPTAICPAPAQVQVGSAYNANATAASGVPPYTFTKVAGPAALTVSAGGAINWTPGDPDIGVHVVTIRVTDRCQQSDECSFTIRVVKGGPFRLCIDKVGPQGVYNGADVCLSVNNVDDATDPLLANGKSVGGFSFLFSYDCSCLQFLRAEKGALLVQQRWEFFTYRFGALGNGNCGAGCPSCLIRVVAIADVNNGAAHPNLTRDNQGEWVRLCFRTSSDLNLGGSCCPVNWHWFDCTDNTVSDSTGNVTYVADSLYSANGNLMPLPGNIEDCDQISGGEGKPSPRRNIIFCNGQICIPHPDDIDDRGDLNLNGLANEPGDVVVYENYFLYGDIALSPDPQRKQAQIAASDINGDGYVLTVADLIRLIRILTHDAFPLPKSIPADYTVNMSIAQTGSRAVVSANSGSELGGLYLKFNVSGTVGAPELLGAAEGMIVKTNLVGRELSVLIYSDTKDVQIGANAGEILRLPVEGEIELVSSEASNYQGAALPTAARVAPMPTKFGLSQNYPNPFNGKTSLTLALPVSSDYKVTVYNVAGQVVRTFEGSAPAGNRTIVWDGTDANGKAVSSGIYFFKAAAKDFSAVVKGLYLK